MTKEENEFMWYDKYIAGAAMLALAIGAFVWWVLFVALAISLVGLAVAASAWLADYIDNKAEELHKK